MEHEILPIRELSLFDEPNNGSNWSPVTDISNDTFLGNESNSAVKMPIDMQFNDGHLLSIIGYGILFVFSAFGNLTVLSVILKRKFRGISSISRMDFMLLHLAIADLMVAFLMMPLEIVWSITVSWYAGDVMCRVMTFFRVFGLYLSSFVLVCLAFDRYFAVKYPMQNVSSSNRGKFMIILAWIFAGMCSLPQVFIFHVATHPTFHWYTQCVDFGSLTPQTQMIYNVFVMCMMYALPLAFIIVLYCGIVMELFKRTRISTNTSTTLANSSTRRGGHEPDGLRRSGVGNLGRAKIKTLKMTITIVFIFFVCWTPYYIMCLWYWIDNSSAQVLDQKIQKALFLFASTNSTANPIVYGVFHLKSTFCRKASSSGNGARSTFSRSSMYRENTLCTTTNSQMSKSFRNSNNSTPTTDKSNVNYNSGLLTANNAESPCNNLNGITDCQEERTMSRTFRNNGSRNTSNI